MLKVEYPRTVDKEGNLLEGQGSFQDIAWHNIQEGAKTQNIQVVVACSKGWFKANPDASVLDLQKKLREEDVPLTLFATEPSAKEFKGKALYLAPVAAQSEENLEYELCYICQPYEKAKADVVRVWKTLEENDEHLNQCGELKVKEESADDNKETPDDNKETPDDNKETPDDNKETSASQNDETSETNETSETPLSKELEALQKNDVLTILANNFAKMESRMMSQKEINDAMNGEIRQAEAVMGKKSEAKQVGQTNAGEPVYAHYVNGRVVSRYGLVVKDVTEEDVTRQMAKIVLVQDRSTWKW